MTLTQHHPYCTLANLQACDDAATSPLVEDALLDVVRWKERHDAVRHHARKVHKGPPELRNELQGETPGPREERRKWPRDEDGNNLRIATILEGEVERATGRPSWQYQWKKIFSRHNVST
jgi:hypothetical protein